MHVVVTHGAHFEGDLILYTTGLLITVLLLALTLRAARLPGTPLANIGFALCALLWSVSGLVYAVMAASGLSWTDPRSLSALAAQYTGAVTFPIPILSVWRPFALTPRRRELARILQIGACLTAILIAALVWAKALSGVEYVSVAVLRRLTACNDALLLVAGAAVLLRPRTTPHAVFAPSLTIVLAACGAALALILSRNAQSTSAGGHLVMLVVLGSFLLFARFRYADVLLRHGVRIVLAGMWAFLLAFVTQSDFAWNLTRASFSPTAVHVFFIIVMINTMLLSFTFVDKRVAALLSRWLFRPPDYRAEVRRLGHRLRSLAENSEVAVAIEESASRPLELSGARFVALDSLGSDGWPPALLEGEIVELAIADPLRAVLPLPNTELLIPVTTAGGITHALLVSHGPARPGLVTNDLNYLRTAAALGGNRLDALAREREAIERQSHEALLLQQVTEAELQALRAQVNPHFLFNSLNTIADLIVRDPPRAEAMTVRLAGVFRHVLAHSRRPLTSIGDEIEFLRTYLYIEEVRFGDRLQVEIDVSPEVAAQSAPSLILQPLVENALKHGLGPKPGPGHLWISARADGDQVRLCVEDDGLGPGPASARGQGLGLANVEERLRTLYQDRASLTLEAREGGGTRVTIRIPRGEAIAAA